jgi:5-methyltetrahydropteroyltriglutamate--homocysteine methyltransferase
MSDLLKKALEVLTPEQLWVNPDCGLKTRGWKEVELALTKMVETAADLRTSVNVHPSARGSRSSQNGMES